MFRPAGVVRTVTIPSAGSPVPGPLVAQAAIERRALRATRTRLAELAGTLHCSIIGTCLSTRELRQLLVRLGLAFPDIDDHAAHKLGVTIAGRHDAAGKLLNKALDQRHRLAINRFAKAQAEEDVQALWHEALRSGDIPGAYWAVMTHPASTHALIGAAFGEVHMLSHLVGAANRADIRRLRTLEAEKAELEAKVARQQVQLRDAIVSRDAEIGDLRDALAKRIVANVMPAIEDTDRTTVALVADLERKLAREAARRQTLEQRLHTARAHWQQERAMRVAAEQREAALRDELVAVETMLPLATASAPSREPPLLGGTTILYVGGRPQQIVGLRGLADRAGVSLLHHDGGVEDNISNLGGLVSRADVVVFPVDCVSHAAVTMVKQLCQQGGKGFVALRSASASAFLACVSRLAERAAAVPGGRSAAAD